MRKPTWFSISFLKDWALWTLSLASGGPTVLIALYFFFQGQQPPKSGILTVVGVCSLVAAWGAGLRERRLRIQASNPTLTEGKIRIVSASSIKGRYEEGAFAPWGERYLAVCCLYNDGDSTVRNCRLEVTVDEGSTKGLPVRAAYWLDERQANVTFKRKTYRHIVLATWNFSEPVVVPGLHAGERLDSKELTLGHHNVQVSLRNADEVVSTHYFEMQINGYAQRGSAQIGHGYTDSEIGRVDIQVSQRT